MSSSALQPIATFLAHEDPINHICFSKSGRVMATSDTNLLVKVWHDRELERSLNLRLIGEGTQSTDRIRGIQLTADGARLFVVAGEYLASYDLTTGSTDPDWIYTAPRMLVFFVVPPTSIALSEHDTLAASFDNGTLASWHSNGSQRSLIRHNSVPRYIQFIPNEELAGTESFGVSRWQLGARTPMMHRQTDERIYGMSVSHDGSLIALRRLFSTVVQRLDDGSTVASYKQGRGLPLLSFAPTSNTLAVGSQHAIIVHHDQERDQRVFDLTDAELIALTYLPDGSQIVAGCSDGRLRTWDNPYHQERPSNAE